MLKFAISIIYFSAFYPGLIDESVPLAALIAPALSRDSIKVLTRGAIFSNTNITDEEEIEDNIIVPDKLTGPLLAKVAV